MPILLASGLIALLNLLLLWNENRIRQNPSAQWRLQPLTAKQRRQRWMQPVTSIGALLLILAEVVTHPWFHHEMQNLYFVGLHPRQCAELTAPFFATVLRSRKTMGMQRKQTAAMYWKSST